MKKHYAFFIPFLLLFGLPMCAQPIVFANDDHASVPSGNPQTVLASVLSNDTIEGTLEDDGLQPEDVILSQVSSSSPLLQLQPDGAVAIVGGTLTDGIYILDYRICAAIAPASCAVARFTLFVNHCSLPTPTAVNDAFLACGAVATVDLGNLPASGTWTVRHTRDDIFIEDFQGTGTNFTLLIDETGTHGYSVIDASNNCQSAEKRIAVYSPNCGFMIRHFGTYHDQNANGYVDPGDVVNYQIVLYNELDVPVQSVTMESLGMNISGTQLDLLPAQSTNNTAFSGVHVITEQEVDSGGVGTVIVAYANAGGQNIYDISSHSLFLGPVRGFSLHAFVDLDGNGARDANEPEFPYGVFRYEKNNNGQPSYYYGNQKIYENNTQSVFDFSLVQVFGDNAAQYTITAPAVNDMAIPASGFTDLWFPVTVTPYEDVSVRLHASRRPRPGFEYRAVVSYENQSYMPQAAAAGSFLADAAIPITGIIPTTLAFDEEGFTNAPLSLAPFESRDFYVRMQTPTIPTVQLGDAVTLQASVSVAGADAIAANNTATINTTISGSYDPNDILENHGPQIPVATFGPNDYLTYTIRFENTGNAHALNILVQDLLDNQLDENTVRPVSGSHPYVMERAGSQLQWRFPAINLPPSTPMSDNGHGYVSFQVKPKSGYAAGDIIPNTAAIYFDFNPAIVTNTWETEFVETLRRNDFAGDAVVVYPNPASEQLHIMASEAIELATIYNISGQKVLEKQLDSKNVSVDVSALPQGFYLLRLQTASGSTTKKITLK